MYKLCSPLLLIIYFCSCQLTFYGQTPELNFREISPPGGFTRYAIQSITHDDLGYVWMGTQQGLIRYDSENTDWFIPKSSDSLSMPSERIFHVNVDNDNQVWVCTFNGLFKFKRKTQNFEHIKYTYEDGSKGVKRIMSTLHLKDGQFLVMDNNYLGVLEYEKKRVNRIAKDKIIRPRVLFKDSNNKIWIGTRSGDVFLLDPSTKNVEKIMTIDAIITCIYVEKNELFIGTEENGAKIYDTNGDFKKQVVFKRNSPSSKSERVRVIKRDSQKRLWFGTDDGLFIDNNGELIWIDPDKYPGVPHNSIFQIYEDKKGGVWIGTWSGGLALMHYSDNNFVTYRHSKSYNSISSNVVSSFLQTGENELLVGTEIGGLNVYNMRTQNFDIVSLDPNLQIKNIKTLCKDKYGGIWAGTFRKGLWYKPAGSSKFQVFTNGPDDGKHLSAISVYSLLPVDSGVWIGTFYGGLNFYSFETKTIQRRFVDNTNDRTMSRLSVQSLLIDDASNLWVGTTNNFLYRIHLPTEKITNIMDLQSNEEYRSKTIYTLWQHPSGKIWIGTKNRGVLIYDPISNNIEAFDNTTNLKKKNVYGIIDDDYKNIWITTNKGLTLYNTSTNTKRNFVYSDGIQSNIFSPQAIYKDTKGILYFGGTNGFTKINPSEIKINSDKPYTIINALHTINNKSIYPTYSKNGSPEPIYLEPNEISFRINFSCDNYLIPEKNKYQYRLQNYHDNWVSNGNKGSVLLNGLDAGEYLFEVKAANNDGIWNDAPTQMKIIVGQHWYKTSLAYFIYFLFLVAIVYAISRFYLERIKLKRAILLEKNQRENEEEIHEMKMKFFTNVSHEFRTPLTLISWPVKQLLNSKSISVDDKKNLEVAKRNVNRLLQLINQIIDVRKLENADNKLHVSTIDVIQLIKDIQQGFLGEAKSKKIDFSFDSKFTTLEIEADQQKLDTIIYNFLSNAFKFVQPHGLIKILVDKNLSTTPNLYNNQLSFGQIQSDDFIHLIVEDNGLGIDNEDLFKIFNRFEQGKQNEMSGFNATEGSGIGLSVCKEFALLHHGKIMVQSSLGKGSRFTLLLPMKQKAQEMLFESHQKVKNLGRNESLEVRPKKVMKPENRNRILVVEDNPDFRSFLSDFLDTYYDVDYAANGEEGLALMAEQNMDLIVSDVMMPEMDGFEFCNIVKAQVETSHIPVILLTALSSVDNLIIGLDKGADAYLTKPFDETILLKQIENLLDQRRRIHKNFSKQFIDKKTIDVSGLDNFFLTKVRKVVENNLSNEEFSLEKLAEELLISRSNLHRKIKSLSGLSTSEFVNLIRIKNAVKLIREENCRFSEVAFRVGFSSQSYFTRCFKKVYNVSPKEYFENNNIETD